jgi:hypothetical protein
MSRAFFEGLRRPGTFGIFSVEIFLKSFKILKIQTPLASLPKGVGYKFLNPALIIPGCLIRRFFSAPGSCQPNRIPAIVSSRQYHQSARPRPAPQGALPLQVRPPARRVSIEHHRFIILYGHGKVKDRNRLDSNDFISFFKIMTHVPVSNKLMAIPG